MEIFEHFATLCDYIYSKLSALVSVEFAETLKYEKNTIGNGEFS